MQCLYLISEVSVRATDLFLIRLSQPVVAVLVEREKNNSPPLPTDNRENTAHPIVKGVMSIVYMCLSQYQHQNFIYTSIYYMYLIHDLE